MINAYAVIQQGGELVTYEYDPGRHSASGSPLATPQPVAQTLEFAARHDIVPPTRHFNFSQANEAMRRPGSGEARYRIVLSH